MNLWSFRFNQGLSASVEADGTSMNRLTLREPTVSDLEICDKEKDNLAQSIRLLTLISENPLSPQEVRLLGRRDFSRLRKLSTAPIKGVGVATALGAPGQDTRLGQPEEILSLAA